MGTFPALYACCLLALACSNFRSIFAFDCSDCFDSVDEANCTMLEEMFSCYDNNGETCANNFRANFDLNVARRNYEQLGCAATPTVTPTTSPPSVTCSDIPIQLEGNLEQISPHSQIEPAAGVSRQCRVIGDEPVSHCSLFMHSHLRPFLFQHGVGGIQTCSLPGAWQLFRHQNLLVEVEGTGEDLGSLHTQLRKVTVTFPEHSECNPVSKSYIAYNTEPLPQSFECDTPPHNNTRSPLQLAFNAEGTAVTITASWLNSTIIIRKSGGFLAVSLKVTGRMAFESEGLCTGCPVHQFIDTRMSNSLCGNQHSSALTLCFFTMATSQSLLHITNVSYVDACAYSLLKSGSPHVKNMVQGLSMDALLLSDHGTVPRSPLIPPASLITSRPPAMVRNNCHTEQLNTTAAAINATETDPTTAATTIETAATTTITTAATTTETAAATTITTTAATTTETAAATTITTTAATTTTIAATTAAATTTATTATTPTVATSPTATVIESSFTTPDGNLLAFSGAPTHAALAFSLATVSIATALATL